MDLKTVDGIIEAALKEDLPSGDVTSEALVPPEAVAKAVLLAKEEGVLAGIGLAWLVFAKIDPKIAFEVEVQDGQEFKAGTVLARLEGNAIALLKGERTALNFLQRLSGVATATRRFVKALEGTKTRVLDTRKTTPVLRALEKYAVQQGGGVNHRMSLSDMALIKDNHIAIVGGVGEAVRRAKAKVPAGIKIEVEVTDLRGATEALEGGADMIMLDNMDLAAMKEVVDFVGGRVPLEVSGKVTLERAKAIAAIGVDYVSVGALTHSIRSIDISLEFGREA